MSLDLLQEFGYYKEENPLENPWEHEVSLEAPKHISKDDEFGDFEAPEPPVRGAVIEESSTSDPPIAIFQTGSSGFQSSVIISPEPIDAKSVADYLDEDWGDFVDHDDAADREPGLDESAFILDGSQTSPVNQKASQDILTPTTSKHESSSPSEGARPIPPNQDTEQLNPSIPSAPTPNRLPPSNIPPPSILLLYTATLLQTLPAEIKSLLPTTPTPSPHPNQALNISQPTLNSINLLLSSARATARILAGRKLRWKRDSLLSQNMKIGPARAGNSGGMKLAGIDKSESRREDQEAAEVVRIWKWQVGSLRARIAKAKLRLAVPEIAEVMQVRVEKGALAAPRQCVLCGLRREERVQRVDGDGEVEDSFGEWWVEYWGHVDCWRFWEGHERELEQRR